MFYAKCMTYFIGNKTCISTLNLAKGIHGQAYTF